MRGQEVAGRSHDRRSARRPVHRHCATVPGIGERDEQAGQPADRRRVKRSEHHALQPAAQPDVLLAAQALQALARIEQVARGAARARHVQEQAWRRVGTARAEHLQ